jgi:hypothetical protein
VGDFDAGFEKAVGKTKMAAGSYPGRSILAGAIPALIAPAIALASFKYQVALAVLVGIPVVGIVV